MLWFLIGFTFVATAALTYSALNTYYAVVDLQRLHERNVVDGRLVIGRGNLRAQLLRTVECVALLAVAILAILDVPQAPGLRRLITSSLLTIVSAGIFINSIVDYYQRRHLHAVIYRRRHLDDG